VPNDTDDNETGSTGAGTASFVGMVRLGAPVSFGDATKITYDSYEAHRSTPIEPLLIGDANLSGSISGFDLVVTKNEILNKSLATGQPDCNSSGAVSGFDLVCIKNIILGK